MPLGPSATASDGLSPESHHAPPGKAEQMTRHRTISAEACHGRKRFSLAPHWRWFKRALVTSGLFEIVEENVLDQSVEPHLSDFVGQIAAMRGFFFHGGFPSTPFHVLIQLQDGDERSTSLLTSRRLMNGE